MRSFGQMAQIFGKLAAGGLKKSMSSTLDTIGEGVKKECQKEIGEYQPGIGPYPATAPLSPVTLERKARKGHGKGGNPDTPLYATGEYQESIQYMKDTGKLSVEIGTNVPYVKFHEVGTSEMPPRPIFGPATMRAIPPLLPVIKKAAIYGIFSGAWGDIGAEGITHAGGKKRVNILP